MRTCSSFAVRRHFLPISLSHRPVSCSLIHSCSVLAASTESPVQFDSQPAVVPIHKSSPIPPTPTSSLASSTTQHSERLQHAPALTVLHTTRELIARILPPESLELSFWNKVLCEVSDEITRSSLTSKQDSATIVVYPVDEFSGGESLVGALLQDPFSREVENEQTLRRWEGHDQDTKLHIEYAAPLIRDTKNNPGDPHPSSSGIVHLSSSFLASLPFPARLTELRPTRELSQDDLRLLYTAHIPIVLLNPLTTPLTTLSSNPSSNSKQTILPYPLPPHALLLITSPSPISTSPTLPPAVFKLGVSPDRVFLVDPGRALSSIRALRTNPSDPLQVQRYSDDALASSLSTLRRQLQSVPTPAQKGGALVSAAVGVLRSRLDKVETELAEAAALTRTLRSEATQESEDARRAVFGPAPELVPPDEQNPPQPPVNPPTVRTAAADQSGNKVRVAMARADAIVLPVLSTLTWWRVLWAPDEVDWRMRQAVRDAWVGSITSGLQPALATLPRTQATHASRALSRAAALPPTLRSHVLLNALRQLAHAPSFALEPRALLRPLERRLARLDAGTTAALARAAQALLLRVASSAGAGAATGAVMLAHGAGEAAGAGLLVAVAGVRWAIGRWEKVRRLWRADWARVKEAAERDVEAALDQALETQVLIVPVRAAEGIESIVAKRVKEIGHLRQEVDKLDTVISDSKTLAHRSSYDSSVDR